MTDNRKLTTDEWVTVAERLNPHSTVTVAERDGEDHLRLADPDGSVRWCSLDDGLLVAEDPPSTQGDL